MFDTSILGNRIKELRKQQGLTQSAFAEELCVSFQAVSNWERGLTPPELSHLVHIASLFGVSVDDLLHPKSDDLFLGIDGGGTKTEFLLVSAEGYVQKRLVKVGCNPNDVGYAKMLSLLIDGIGDVLLEARSIKAVFCGIAGISTGNYAKRLHDDLKKHYPRIRIEVKNDSSNLFALDSSADMAVISGTGSVVFVKDGDAYRRLGGWGYLLDSAGSAYDIGRAALREALREEDRREAPSLIGRLLREKLNTATVWEHVNTVYSEGKPYIAALASVVFDAYLEGEPKAVDIVDKNAEALAELLNAGVELYGAAPVAIASGGMFEHYGSLLLPHIEKYSRVQLKITDLPPIYGACKNAYVTVNRKIPEEFYQNFKRTYGGVK